MILLLIAVFHKCAGCNAFISGSDDVIAVSRKEDPSKILMHYHSCCECISKMDEDIYASFAPKLKFKTWQECILKHTSTCSEVYDVETEIDRLKTELMF